MKRIEGIEGNKYGRLTVIKQDHYDNYGHPLWLCKCDCGNETHTAASKLLNGKTLSCGCYHIQRAIETQKTHGMTKTRIYKTWQDMKARCNRKTNKDYMRYGGRGITICNEWINFEPFMKWAYENGYSDNLELDRIDYNGNYEPSNCRFATRREQTNNTSRNHYITCRGITKTMSEWADVAEVSYSTFRSRINESHWEPEEAIFSPRKNWHRRTGD
jgi:hypothetical protein